MSGFKGISTGPTNGFEKPQEGQLYYDEHDRTFYVYANGEWVDSLDGGTIPAGVDEVIAEVAAEIDAGKYGKLTLPDEPVVGWGVDLALKDFEPLDLDSLLVDARLRVEQAQARRKRTPKSELLEDFANRLAFLLSTDKIPQGEYVELHG